MSTILDRCTGRLNKRLLFDLLYLFLWLKFFDMVFFWADFFTFFNRFHLHFCVNLIVTNLPLVLLVSIDNLVILIKAIFFN